MTNTFNMRILENKKLRDVIDSDGIFRGLYDRSEKGAILLILGEAQELHILRLEVM